MSRMAGEEHREGGREGGRGGGLPRHKLPISLLRGQMGLLVDKVMQSLHVSITS